MVGDEILMEIDSTLDQLIKNAEAVQNVEFQELTEIEIEGFKKTQESLVQHLIHMDQFLETKHKSLKLQDKRSASYKIQEKLLKFEKMKTVYRKSLSDAHQKAPMLSKRRNKRFLVVR